MALGKKLYKKYFDFNNSTDTLLIYVYANTNHFNS